jgi:G patch domain-containing protein 1
LNDADDDDIDVYEHAAKEARHLAFDETETADDLHHTLASSRLRKPIQKTPSRPPIGAESAETFSNGAPVLLGFALSQLSLTDDQWFVPIFIQYHL